MADKSTSIPVGICEDVLVVVANVTIFTDFLILDFPEETCNVRYHLRKESRRSLVH